ncbi:thymidine phosphorylase [bacterium]|nr:thymidine phosphorylase [bacterium]
MNPSEFIRAKRDGQRLDPEEIEAFVLSFVKGNIADYQMSAFLMAVYLNGMSDVEASALTEAYIRSGYTIDWSDLGAVTVDKHSIGGVGDKVSLILAPMVAACGGYVPMLSGRGLGHTGGTLDKLESIPGFTTNLSIEEFKLQVKNIGCAITRQSPELAPADGKIYALRDVTATVESIPLISASIMSKKIAEGAEGLVIDLKTGSGAFMDTIDRARALAKMLIAIGKSHGQKVKALVTDMSQPLGSAIGNALEVEECILLMRREIDLPRLEYLTCRLAAEMLMFSGIVSSVDEGLDLANKKLSDGSVLVKFAEMVEAQSGNPRVADDISIFPRASVIKSIVAPKTGYIKSVNTREVGMAGVNLGAGRLRKEDKINQSVGFKVFKEINDKVEEGKPFAEVYATDSESANIAAVRFVKAYTISEEVVRKPRLIHEKVE